ncbi:MAG: response regulator transcription factor [Lachnospiraceae bacterium]|nr:response regulator transcription factor [Cuneatibacter sp.]MDD6455295.1 response regulator transcription factor [Lachnospiraceae bacterium]
MFQILVVEDDAHVRSLLETILTDAGYFCTTAVDGMDALLRMDEEHVDLAIVDVMMPRMGGNEFTRTLRETQCEIPILMLTARLSHEDKRMGFQAGVDDFLTKPFDEEELLWRVKALLRRSRIVSEQELWIGGTHLDYSSMQVEVEGVPIAVTPKEFLLLYKLLSYPSQLFTKRQIMDEIWNYDSDSDEHTVEVHINRLREKFRDDADFSIKTIRGFGYMAMLNKEGSEK